MNLFVQYMNEFSAKDALVYLFLFLFCLKQASELLSWFFSKTGLETKTVRKHKAAVEKLERHDAMLNDLSERLDGISKRLNTLSERIIDTERVSDHRRIRELRKEILDFANCMRQRGYDKEMCEEIFDSYEEYEGLLEKWKEKNGRTTRAMAEIKEYYQALPMPQ